MKLKEALKNSALLIIVIFLFVATCMLISLYVTTMTKFSEIASLPLFALILAICSRSFLNIMLNLNNYSGTHNKKVKKSITIVADLFVVITLTTGISGSVKGVYNINNLLELFLVGLVTVGLTLFVYLLGMALVQSSYITEKADK